MGSPDIAVSVLHALVEAGYTIACVYSQPPRKAGRGKSLRPTPVHKAANDLGIDVRTPLTLKSSEEHVAFSDLELDAAVVLAYGLILPQEILDAPRLGCLNLHASLLPRWRGAAPIQRAIMAGDEETGIDAMLMEAGLDTGPVLKRVTTPITPEDTAGSLHDRLADIAAELAPVALAGLADGSLSPVAQPSDGVTYAEKIDSEDQKIDWTKPARQIDAQIRGLSPSPGAYCYWRAPGSDEVMRLKCLLSNYENVPAIGSPGTVIDNELLIACGNGESVRLLKLQKPGGKPLQAKDFLRGVPILRGQHLLSVPRMRKVTLEDEVSVDDIVEGAFKRKDEVSIIRHLERDNDVALQMVIEHESIIIAHVMLFKLKIDDKVVAAGLGPVSVDPKLQGQGYGSSLIRAALSKLSRKYKVVFVLGAADYYSRFGFERDIAQNYDAPYKEAGESFRALIRHASAPLSGRVTYPAAFGGS